MADLIERQAAIDEILRLTHYDTVRSLYEATVANKYEDCYEDGIIDAIDVIVGLSSPQPERKTGRWMFIERREPQFDLYGVKTWAVAYRCSECGLIHAVIEDFGHYAFCPRCGAKMEGCDG